MANMIITGATGLLGSNLAVHFREAYNVFGTYNSHPCPIPDVKAIRMDASSKDSIQNSISSVRPDYVVHCAAETRVDFCEENTVYALAINTAGTKTLSKICQKFGAKLIYISTDSVYEGSGNNYTEADIPNPVNVYGKSKLYGEIAVKKHAYNHLIFRTNIYGWNLRPKPSLSEWILEQARNGSEKIPGFTDIVFSPIIVNDLANIIDQSIKQDLCGTYNAGAMDSCSKYDFARMICSVFGLPTELVRKATSDEKEFTARRPRNTSLDVSRLSQAIGADFVPSVHEGVIRFYELWKNGYAHSLKGHCQRGETEV